ncbi:MAG: acyl carrier protein [Bacteroidales bacterium]|nr:acyl carrier protein [Bacteroidales bacterium]
MDTLERLKAVFKGVKPDVNTDNITNDTLLMQELGVDSLSMILLALAIEKEFNFHFDTVSPFKTVGEVVAYVESKTK